jgi:pimeloyl-ACP methyl ester carboxylesterase
MRHPAPASGQYVGPVIVFVHGVPETAAVWRKVREGIGRESVALELPGFGNPRPAGFGATKDEYVDWLRAELARIDEPVDLVGHDWGAGLTYGLVTRHGDAVRSWAADVANLGHPDYVWHDFAKIWQTPGDGEAYFEAQAGQPVEDRAAGLEMIFGLSHEDAMEMAAASDAAMSSCILDLYRSAVPNVHAEWGPWSPTAAPGLVLHPTGDPFGDGALAEEVADALGARFAPVDGAGHFWPYSAADQAIPVLESFWASLD